MKKPIRAVTCAAVPAAARRQATPVENPMKKMIVAALLIACVAPARAGSALECLKASAQNAGLAGCLGEAEATAPSVAGAETGRPTSLTVVTLKPVTEKSYRRVPTPTGYRDDEDGTLSTGFFKGLDSGFKTVFAAITSPAVAGIQACGAPYRENLGTIAFFGLGVFLSIPASLLGAVLGAPVGAVAGMIAEKTSPGSTKDWYSF